MLNQIYVGNNPVNFIDILGLHLGGPEGPGEFGDIGGSESNASNEDDGGSYFDDIDRDELADDVFGPIELTDEDWSIDPFEDVGDKAKNPACVAGGVFSIIRYAKELGFDVARLNLPNLLNKIENMERDIRKIGNYLEEDCE